MGVKLNKAELENKIYGCWLGKNIGGTMGAPFEGRREKLNITGYTTSKGEPLPNDDLDLQLAWLVALEQVGAKNLNVNALADYWLTYIAPHWNEYGIGKSNLSVGLLPPLSGETENVWKNSNGAWIRSEIWACLAPGFPNIAVKYAIMDASVDHGFSEGTYAEIFTAALESMAFFESDIRTLIEKALEFIPENCRVAKTVNTVLNCYDKKMAWDETRDIVVKENEDLGWFQAPGNLGFMVLGLVYGEGDMKKTLCYAINCGDDTDCTAATCGSILGIIMGADKIPTELTEYIGDRIITISINGMYLSRIPKTCTDLTKRVIARIPEVLSAHRVDFQFTDAQNEYSAEYAHNVLKNYSKETLSRSPYSFEIGDTIHTSAVIEYEKEPRIKPLDNFNVKVTLTNYREDSRYYNIDVFLPEGWNAEYNKTCHTIYRQTPHGQDGKAVWEMTVNVGEKVDGINKIAVMISTHEHAVPLMIPIVLLG